MSQFGCPLRSGDLVLGDVLDESVMTGAPSTNKASNIKTKNRKSLSGVIPASKLISLSSPSIHDGAQATTPARPSTSAITTTSVSIKPTDGREYMQLKVDLGDLTIKKSQPPGDPYGDGDEPAWTTFRGRLRVDGNVAGSSGYKYDVFSLRRNGDNLSAGAVTHPHNRNDQVLNWWSDKKITNPTSATDNLDPNVKDFRLKVFTPSEFLNKQAPANLSVDFAVGGVVYWEVDNDKGGADKGMDPRKRIVEALVEHFASTSGEFAKNLKINFNYKNYLLKPFSAIASWYSSFNNGLNGAINKFKGDLGETGIDIVKAKVDDYISDKLFGQWGKTDSITGIHLFVLIPVSADFYDTLQSFREFGKRVSPDDPFGDNPDLITTIKMFNDNYYTKSSTWLTFGLVPNGTKTSPASFSKALGSRNQTLSFRGGYDSFANGGLGWTDRSEHWTTKDPGIMAGPNIFASLPADPVQPQ